MDKAKEYSQNLIAVNVMDEIPSKDCSSTKIRQIFREGININNNYQYLQRNMDPNIIEYHKLK